MAAEDATPNTTSKRAPAGTIAALCDAYIASREFSALSDGSRTPRRRIVEKIRDDRGTGKLGDLRPDHIRKDVRALTPGAAQNRLKAWRAMFKFAIEEGMIEADPSRDVKAPKGEVKGHRQWTADEIKKYRKKWLDGSPERIAFEVIYWTGARCVDAATLGAQLVDKSGWLSFTQQKTGGPVTIPITADLPPWAEGLSADQGHLKRNLPTNQMHWIVTQNGKPRSVKGLSQWLSKAASGVKLPDDCTAHGLRKPAPLRWLNVGLLPTRSAHGPATRLSQRSAITPEMRT